MITVGQMRARVGSAALRRRLRRQARSAAALLVELAGYAAFAVAGWMVAPALGLAIAGAALLVVAHAIEAPPGDEP